MISRLNAPLQQDLALLNSELSELADLKEQPPHEKIEALMGRMRHVLSSYEHQKQPQELTRLKNNIKQAADSIEIQAKNLPEGEAEPLFDLLDILLEIESLLSRLQGVFLESQNPENIDWKVHKYESLILQVTAFLNQEYAKFPHESPRFTVVDDFCVMPHTEREDIESLLKVLGPVVSSTDASRYCQENLSNLREHWKQFLSALRGMIERSPDKKLIERVCYFIFCEVNLESESFTMIQKLNQVGKNERKGQASSSFSEFLEEVHKNLTAVPLNYKAPYFNQLFNSINGRYSISFDPMSQGNPVHVIYQLHLNGKDVKALGMGNPTIETIGEKEAKVTPEFLSFLTHFKSINKKYLFVSNQDVLSKINTYPGQILGGDETARIKAVVHDLLEQFPDTFFSMILSKNSQFYHQTGPFEKEQSAPLFCKQLLEQMQDMQPCESGNLIPLQVREKILDFELKVKNIVTKIWEIVFRKKGMLSVKEKRIFITLFHEYIVKFILKELNIDAFCICCKDGIDRGAASNATLYSNTLLEIGEKIGKEEQQRIASLMFCRALMVRKRPPFKDRFERFHETFCFSIENQVKLRELVRTLNLWNIQAMGPNKNAK